MTAWAQRCNCDANVQPKGRIRGELLTSGAAPPRDTAVQPRTLCHSVIRRRSPVQVVEGGAQVTAPGRFCGGTSSRIGMTTTPGASARLHSAARAAGVALNAIVVGQQPPGMADIVVGEPEPDQHVGAAPPFHGERAREKTKPTACCGDRYCGRLASMNQGSARARKPKAPPAGGPPPG